MSHWLQGRLDNLVCSLDKMRTAIINVMPEWEGHVEVSPEGNIEIYNNFTRETKKGYHIRVPQNQELGISYGDFALKQLGDGSWHIEYDPGGLPQAIRNAPNALKDEIQAMRTREIASQNGIQIIEDSRSKKGIKQRLRMTPDQIENFVRQMQ